MGAVAKLLKPVQVHEPCWRLLHYSLGNHGGHQTVAAAQSNSIGCCKRVSS